MPDPDWLLWAREIQAIAQTGLAFSKDPYDLDRFTALRRLSARIMTPGQSVVREVFEESGYKVRAVKLAAVWDRARQAQPPTAFSVVRMFFVCALEGGSPKTSLETSEVGWFAETDIPTDLSLQRTSPHHISRMFAHWREPGLATEFD
jgi:Hydrolase of X-linked nucleoside diphosphate N terminal/NUDIX domain